MAASSWRNRAKAISSTPVIRGSGSCRPESPERIVSSPTWFPSHAATGFEDRIGRCMQRRRRDGIEPGVKRSGTPGNQSTKSPNPWQGATDRTASKVALIKGQTMRLQKNLELFEKRNTFDDVLPVSRCNDAPWRACDSLTVNAPYPSCHSNPDVSLNVREIQPEEFAFSSPMSFEIALSCRNFARMWT